MKLTEQQKFILFALGRCCNKCNERLEGRMLQANISKSAFIEIVLKGKMAQKKERALYKNLEDLEKGRFIEYENKILKLTKKGKRQYEKISSIINPYSDIMKIIDSESPMKLTNKAKAVFRLG